jgi:hypothetical protein
MTDDGSLDPETTNKPDRRSTSPEDAVFGTEEDGTGWCAACGSGSP